MAILYRSTIAMLLFFVTFYSYGQTTSTQAGSDGIWSTSANWDNGVPTNGGTATVNKTLSFGNTTTAINITTGGYITIDADVNDPNNNGTLAMNGGTLDVKSGIADFGGGVPFSLGCICNPLNSGTIYVRSGATLILGGNLGVTFNNGLTIIVETGGTLVIERIAVNNATLQNNGSVIYGSNWGGSGSSIGSGTTCTTANSPAASSAGSNSPVCVGGTINLTGTTVSGAESYNWTGPNGYSFTSTTSPNTSRSGATNSMGGTYTLTVTKSGCTRNSSTVVRVGAPAQPSTIIPSSSTPCQSSTGVTYSVVSVSGVSYAWSYSGSGATITSGNGSSSITVSYSSSASSGIWTVTPSNTCGIGATRNLTITLGTLPSQPSAITAGISSPCINSTGNTYNVTSVSGNSYAWSYSGTGATITSGSGTSSITVSYSSSATSGIWTVTPNNSCGNGPTQNLAVVLATGAPNRPSNFTSSVTNPCPNSTGNVYTVPNVSGVTYNWTYSGTGATITSGAGTNSITVTYASATSGNWSVRASNGCGTSNARSTTVTVASAPGQPSAITASNNSPCKNSSGNTYSVSNVAGVTYSWTYSGTGATITSGSGTRTITVSYSASATNGTWSVSLSNGTCFGLARTLAVTLNSAPAQPSTITGTSSPCVNSTGNTYSVTSVSGVSYAWSYSGTGATVTSGIGTNTITVSYSPSAISGTWTVTPSSSCGNGTTQTIAVTISPCTFIWDGSEGTNWATAGNWSDNAVPGSGNDVTIPSGTLNMPIISGSANSRNLTVQSGATLNNNLGGNLSIAGNFTNNGIFTDTGTVVLNGSANQTITGVSTFNNLTLNNASGAKLSNDLTIKGILTLTQGALNPNGNLLTINLNSGAIAGVGIGSITEPIKVVKTCGTKWHHIGNPLGGTTVLFSQLTEHITVANGVLYKYNETNPSIVKEDGWVEITPASFNSTSMVPMIGYNMYVWPKRTNLDIVGMYNHNFSTSVSLTYTSSGEPLSDGWNFLSNPYPSTIDWDEVTGWSKSGVNDAIYVRDKSNERYMSYINGSSINGGSRYISSMQGFWVKGNAASGSISINKNARVTSPVLKLYKGQAGSGNIKLSVSSNGYSDETIINLNSNGTTNFDQSLDAYKLKNSGKNPNISSQLNGVEYSINTISETLVDEIIPIRITTAFVGQYQISVDLSEFQSDMEITLIDKKLNISQDLNLVSDYVFGNSNVDTNRFYIRLKNKESISTGLISKYNNDLFMGSDGSVVTIKLNTDLSTATMSVLNMLGNEVYNNDQVSVTGGLIREQLDVLNSGLYIIKLQVGNQIYTGRVFIK